MVYKVIAQRAPSPIQQVDCLQESLLHKAFFMHLCSTANKYLDAQLDNLINTVREEEGDIADLQREIEYRENRLFLLTGRHHQRVQGK